MFTFFVNDILAYIPTWMWPVLAGAGVSVYFLAGVGTYFPIMAPYARFIKPVSFIVFCLSLFMWGGAGVQDVYKAELDEQKAKVAAAEQASKDANDQLEQSLSALNQIVIQKSSTMIKTIKTDAKVLDKECNIDNATVALYNNIVNNNVTAPTGEQKK
jgi:hypothetical protein